MSSTQSPPAEAILLSVKQVSALTQLGVRTIWRLASSGDLPAPISIGRSKRWDRRAIEAWIAAKAAGVRR